jgi:NADPH-ferrihemoprotein reductase
MLFPALDGLMHNEEDGTAAAVSYKMAVPEYRVVIWESGTKVWDKPSAAERNGQAIYNLNHPCR